MSQYSPGRQTVYSFEIQNKRNYHRHQPITGKSATDSVYSTLLRMTILTVNKTNTEFAITWERHTTSAQQYYRCALRHCTPSRSCISLRRTQWAVTIWLRSASVTSHVSEMCDSDNLPYIVGSSVNLQLPARSARVKSICEYLSACSSFQFSLLIYNPSNTALILLLSSFYPRGASDARVLDVVVCLCVCVCLSVCHTPALCQNG